MRYTLFENQKNELLLIARLLLMMLFVISGWGKLLDFTSIAAYMASLGVPLPTVAAGIAVVMELLVGGALVAGLYTRPLALLLALFVLGTALIGHHYWTMMGPERAANMVQFYKNISIMGGLLLLSVTGAGRYSLDRK